MNYQKSYQKSYKSANFILIVDDNPTNLAVLAQMIKDGGYKVRVAISGENALKQVSQTRPALILLDVMMSGIDGFETCRQLKANPKTADIPVIFMTALSDRDQKVAGLRLGAVDYVTKPFQEEEVLARIRVHQQNGELMRSLQLRNQDLEKEITKRERSEILNRKLESCIEVSTAVLSEASDYFNEAQKKVEKSEKLSAIGELVAGVAHEINNPIGCITNNVEFVAEHSQQLLEHISHYQALLATNRDQIMPADVLKVEQHAQSIDLDYIVEDFPVLIDSMMTSGDRIQAISQSLRTFARSDTTQKQRYDLHEGLDGTLLILRHRLKGEGARPEILLRKDYGTLPEINCYPGQINQVFMNILANAIDAITSEEWPEDSPPALSAAEGLGRSEAPKIEITTAATTEKVIITITDNAGGMPVEVQEHIFESQFTTKTAGKGTGLGLSIAHQIVTETHEGSIDCYSKVGKGTTFTIALPIDNASIDDA
ncbi:MAG: response regulator [Cyanobacteria bacterium J06650_10]